MNQNLLLILLLNLFNASAFSQFESLFGEPPKDEHDTLYFPINGDVQLVVINRYDTWRRVVDFHDAAQPRALSYAQVLGPAPQNTYIFRNEKGEILKVYNSPTPYYSSKVKLANLPNSMDANLAETLKEAGYTNASMMSLNSIEDCRLYNNHLLFPGDSTFVGLIDLRGEEVVPAIYNSIYPYDGRDDIPNKYLVTLGDKFGMLDSNFNVLFAPVYTGKSSKSREGLRYVGHDWVYDHIIAFKGENCGLISEKNQVLIPFEYEYITSGHDSMYLAYDFNEILPRTKNFWGGMQSCTVYDKDFKLLADIQGYDRIEYKGIKQFLVSKNGKLGKINHLGEIIIPLEYDDIAYEKGNYMVKKDGLWGLISLEGDRLLACEFEGINIYGATIYVMKNNLTGIYSAINYQMVAGPQFKEKYWEKGEYILKDTVERYASVQYKPDKCIYISPDGEQQLLWEEEK